MSILRFYFVIKFVKGFYFILIYSLSLFPKESHHVSINISKRELVRTQLYALFTLASI